jgi:hypothetical protein
MKIIMDNIKFRCFGKVSFTNKVQIDKPLESLYKEKNLCTFKKASNENILDIDDKIATLLLQKQRIDLKKKLETLNNLKNTKAAAFSLKAKVLGERKK